LADIDVLRRFGFLHYNIATIHLAEGRHAAAIRCIREAANWDMGNAQEALLTVADAAVRAGSDAYVRHDIAAALACYRAAREAAPEEKSVQALAQSVATQAHNLGVRAFNSGALGEAAEPLWAAHELDPRFAAAEAALPACLRGAAAACFEEGRAQDALVYADRLAELATGSAEDAALLRGIGGWLRENFTAQVGAHKVGTAVLLLQHLARLDAGALAATAVAESVAALTDVIARHADAQPAEVLNAVIALHPLCPSARLSWAGAAAYKAAMTEARRLHVEGALMEAVVLCEPATRYRPRGPDRQLTHVLATLLCRRVQDSLPQDRAAALALHERTLALLEAYRSQGIAAS
jgi:tetratricopeptide (TPR) repeat protein